MTGLLDGLRGFGFSGSEARRLLAQGAVKVNGETCRDPDREVVPGDEILAGKTGHPLVMLAAPHFRPRMDEGSLD